MKKITDYIKRNILIILNKILQVVDIFIPKRNNYWIFPVYFIGKGNFVDNNLAVFDFIRDDYKIKKIILTREVEINENGKNIIILPMKSFLAIWYLLRSNVIFIQHSIWLDLANAKYQISYPLGRKIINLWHGIAPKDISHNNTGIINNRSLLEMPNYKNIVSSKIDKINKMKAFFKSKEEDFWITGNPRCDFLFMEEKKLPESYKIQLKKLKKLINGNKLIIYAPTYREINANGEYYKFEKSELDKLEKFLTSNNIILGIRYHIYRRPKFYKNFFQYKNIIDLSEEVISDFRVIIRVAYSLITDYSSVYVDAIYLEKRCISFSYDIEHYKNIQRGFFANFETIFPGTICHNFQELMDALRKSSKPLTQEEKEKYKKVQSMLFKYIDDKNAERVINKVLSLN